MATKVTIRVESGKPIVFESGKTVSEIMAVFTFASENGKSFTITSLGTVLGPDAVRNSILTAEDSLAQDGV